MRKPAISLFLALLLAGGASAQIYKWVDENGVTHYSDQPMPGAERIEIRTRNPAPTTAAPRTTLRTERRTPARNAEPDDEPRPVNYESITFTSPTPEQTLWNIGGVLSVSLDIQPGLQNGHQVRVYFDGQPVEASGTSVQLQEVWRGTHNLQAEVVDENGRLKIRSEPIRFYVQQTSVLN